MKEREYLFQETVEACGCLIAVWSDRNVLHFGPCCDSCAAMIKRVVKKVWPDVPVTEVAA